MPGLLIKKKGEEHVTFQPDIAWRKSRTSACREALWSVVEKPGEEEWQQQTEEAWTASHIYRGLVPIALAKAWDKVFKDIPASIAQHVSRLFCRYVEKEARERLWKPRCEVTVKWEMANNITASMKQKRTTERQSNGWKQIYGRKLREDECLCGRANTEHDGERCPGEQRDT